MNPRAEQRKLILWTIAMSLGSLVLLWVLYLLRTVLLSTYVSILLAIGFSPAVRWIEARHFVGAKRVLPRWAAILVLYLGFLAAIGILLAVVIPPLVSQTTALWNQLPAYSEKLKVFLVNHKLASESLDLTKELPGAGFAMSGILGAMEGVVGALGTVVTILLLPYYLLVDAASLELGLLQLVSSDRRPDLARVARDVTTKVAAWMGGQLLLCLTIAITASLGLWMLGVPFFYVLGLLAGLGELVPIVGPLVTAVPAVAVGATVSVNTALLVVAYFSVQQLIEGSVLVPKIMERQVGVSPITVILALLIGGELLGFVGALLAVPTAAILQIFIRESLQGGDPVPS